MTTEEDFQRQLDEVPADFQLRLMFADFLQERDDPRAEGYRALAVNERNPRWHTATNLSWWCMAGKYPFSAATLPEDWFSLIEGLPEQHGLKPILGAATEEQARRDYIEDAAALAFAKLPAPRRAELLSGVPA